MKLTNSKFYFKIDRKKEPEKNWMEFRIETHNFGQEFGFKRVSNHILVPFEPKRLDPKLHATPKVSEESLLR